VVGRVSLRLSWLEFQGPLGKYVCMGQNVSAMSDYIGKRGVVDG